MIIDFFAGLSFYVIPYLTGRFFTKKIFQAWILGAFLWFIAYFLIAGIAEILKLNNFSQIIRYLAIGVSTLSFINILVSAIREKPKLNIKDIQVGGFLLVFTFLIYFLIWKRNTPYPLQLNWDIYEHITLANLITQGKLSFFTSLISDTFTFNSYSPIFEILLSLPKIVFQKSLLGVYWWLEYWNYFLTAVASFILAKKLFNDRWLATVSAVLSALVFESVMVYSGFFLIPQTLVALMTIFVIREIKEYKVIFLGIAALVILLMHYVVGILCVAVLALFYLASRFPLSLRFLNIGILIATLTTFILIGLNFMGKWQVLAIEEAAHFNFPILEKAGFILDWYGIMLFVFGLIGYVKFVKNGSYSQKLILALAILILGIAFSPFSYFLKFYVLGHYFVNLIIVAGIGVLLTNLSPVFKTFGIAWLTLVMVMTFYVNQLVYKGPLHFKTYETQISKGEIEAGNWLSSYNKKGNTFLISDPSLQYVLEAISEVNTQGGAYMDLQTRKTLKSVNGSYDPVFVKDKLLSIQDLLPSDQKPDRKVLFAVGGRYFAWQRLPANQKESSFYNIWSPKTMTENDKTYVDFLANSKQFKAVYRNDEIVIFEVL